MFSNVPWTSYFFVPFLMECFTGFLAFCVSDDDAPVLFLYFILFTIVCILIDF